MPTTEEVCAELKQFLNDTGTAHYFSMLGLLEGMARVAEMLEISASTRGNMVTTAMVDGKPIILGLNAYIKP